MEHRYEIFISYRRDGGAERAELLKLLFEKHGYIPDQIFMDTHSIDSCNFKQRIKEAIFQAKYFVLVVCEGNFDKVKPEDYWIFEIEEAMSLQKQIIPVFFDGIGGIDSGKLPVNIKPLAQIQGIIY